MRIVFLSTFILYSLISIQSFAAEGSSIAGVAGGSDMRSAFLPPPGLYGVGVAAFSQSEDFFDGNGNQVPLLNDLEFDSQLGALALLYVPKFKLAGGSVGLVGAISRGKECGRLTAWTLERCMTGWGDPYVEVNWSRFFGSIRPSKYPDAFPIAEGLALQFGLGAVIPTGRYDAALAASQGLSIGNNVLDIAPMAAFSYTSPPVLAEGTELSSKLYWNNYQKNKDTDYQTGDILSLDFALTERIGRVQFGMAGFYARQIEDDKQFGFNISPDGRRAQGLSLGPVLAYDMPEYGGSLKVKLQMPIMKRNATDSKALMISYSTKLY